MKLEVYALKDSKIKAFMKPIYVHNRDQIVRDMTMVVNDQEHPIARNVEDYHLYQLGVFDDEIGKFDLFDAPEHLMNISSLVNNKE